MNPFLIAGCIIVLSFSSSDGKRQEAFDPTIDNSVPTWAAKYAVGISCPTNDTVSGVHIAPTTDPKDVPAIKREKAFASRMMLDCPPLPDGSHGKSGEECYVAPEPKQYDYKCADKSRILLTSEDGHHWCHKPQP